MIMYAAYHDCDPLKNNVSNTKYKVRRFFHLRNVNVVGFTIYLITVFPSYDHLQPEIYLIEFTLLTMDPLFLEY
jgi:hypothetical protein